MASVGTEGGQASRSIGVAARAFHWISAALVMAAFGLAWSFNTLGPGRTAGLLVDLHRDVGLTILALTALRLAWRALHPLPPLPRGPAWKPWLASGVQITLYLALLAQPLLGWASSSALGDTVTYLGVIDLPDLVTADPDRAEWIFALHRTVGFVILAMIALHVAGALRHARDGVLGRMVTGRPID